MKVLIAGRSTRRPARGGTRRYLRAIRTLHRRVIRLERLMAATLGR